MSDFYVSGTSPGRSTGGGAWGSNEACVHCGLCPTTDDITGDGVYADSDLTDLSHDYADPCLGVLPGVFAACCGHGDPDAAYILFENGNSVRHFSMVRGDRVTVYPNGTVEAEDTREWSQPLIPDGHKLVYEGPSGVWPVGYEVRAGDIILDDADGARIYREVVEG